ncbi:RNase adapter RapZ [Salinicoccus sp. ID82-1]|uniref:RNase adapter RapZ n=1 Tax=Salinicoccus cyprini TaxID=2493691 RepID=A0A558AR90_9STAP|nr:MULTISPECIES: RNase adapter RapZ [Salinicoccus]MCG1010159.1 RNase adapter RapZ [Salinicoccus sp. ID82-1]TVT26785.1 RNase adapter RapZ [Salinicoccus cyprini]
MKQLIIVTGMSGAGKSVAIEALEDMGYFCIDNLPPILLQKVVELMETTDGQMDRVGLGIDLRGKEFFDRLVAEIEKLRDHPDLALEIFFIDASDDRLVTRYKETRRAHPLDHEMNLLDAITKERELLDELKGHATHILDSTNTSAKELRGMMFDKNAGENRPVFNVNVMSFGFKHGIPIDADLVFDVRFLPNPHYVDVLRPQTGLDKPVSDYVLKWKETKVFYAKLYDLLKYMLPQFMKEGKSQLIIAIGCTGGQHRSVTLAEKLVHDISEDFDFAIRAVHRDAPVKGSENEKD